MTVDDNKRNNNGLSVSSLHLRLLDSACTPTMRINLHAWDKLAVMLSVAPLCFLELPTLLLLTCAVVLVVFHFPSMLYPLICFVTSYCMCNTTFHLSACCILDPSLCLAYIGNLLLPGISIFCCFQPVIT